MLSGVSPSQYEGLRREEITTPAGKSSVSDPISCEIPPRTPAATSAHGVTDPALERVLGELDRLTNWEKRPRGEMRVGLDCIRDLSGRLACPQRHFRSIHVTGTKGKSSTCALLDAALRQAGFRVGRYASPHVEHIGERMMIDGAPVGESLMAEVLDAALDVFRAASQEGTAGRDATWFDILTVAAFDLFRRQGVEWAVVEAGLGGRLDSTNIIDSEIAVITNVELEHTEVLGATRGLIAFEKAGIIKPGRVAVTPLAEEDEAGAVIAAKVREAGARLVVPAIPGDATIAGRNALVVGAVLDVLGECGIREKADGHCRPLGHWLLDEIDGDAARLPGRMERIEAGIDGAHVPVVIDGAHVPFNLRAVLADLRRDPVLAGPFVAVVSIAPDKDASGLLSVLAGENAEVILTRATARSRPPVELSLMAGEIGLRHRVEADPLLAYKSALHDAAQGGRWVLVTGSLYLAGVLPR